jgi:hypothetical protein
MQLGWIIHRRTCPYVIYTLPAHLAWLLPFMAFAFHGFCLAWLLPCVAFALRLLALIWRLILSAFANHLQV